MGDTMHLGRRFRSDRLGSLAWKLPFLASINVDGCVELRQCCSFELATLGKKDQWVKAEFQGENRGRLGGIVI